MDKTIASAGISIVEPKSTMNPGTSLANEVPTSFRIVQQKPKYGVNSANDSVRVISIEEYKEAALCLAEAFAEDDVARYFIDVPDREHWSEEDRWSLHVGILEYVTYAHCLKGLVTTVGPNYGTVALW